MDLYERTTFRRLTIGEPGAVSGLIDRHEPGGVRRLDPRTEAILQLGALIALDAPSSSYRATVEAAMSAGADVSDLLGVLIAVAETVGSARVVAAAPRIALAAGYDVDAALERLDPAEP